MPERELKATGTACLDALDRAIQHGPDAPHEEIAKAVGCVIDLRNHVLEQYRAGKLTRSKVDRINSILSLAHGAEHPLIGFHLHRLEQTRDAVNSFLVRL